MRVGYLVFGSAVLHSFGSGFLSFELIELDKEIVDVLQIL